MREEYDFSNARKNPYASQLKQQTCVDPGAPRYAPACKRRAESSRPTNAALAEQN